MSNTSGNQPEYRRELKWATNGTEKDYKDLPDDVRQVFGYAIAQLQADRVPGIAKPAAEGLPGYVWKLVEDDGAGTYRCFYTVKLAGAVYVLHAFKKTSTSGIGTPKKDLQLVKDRLKAIENAHKQAEVAARKATKNSPKEPLKGQKGKGKGK